MFSRRYVLILTLAALLSGGAPLGQDRAEAANSSVVSSIEALLNAERARSGRSALTADQNLNRAAANHASDMVRRGYFAHKSPEGRTHSDRIRASGYCRSASAENIAQGYSKPADVMTGWMNSAGHRRNILNRKYTRFGIAKQGTYWVMTLAGPCK